MAMTMAALVEMPKRATRTSMKRRTAIATEMKNLRIGRGISIDQAAKKMGVSRWTWERWERAQCSIPTERLADIDRVLAADHSIASHVQTFSQAIRPHLAAA